MTDELTKEAKIKAYQAKWREDNAEKKQEYGIKYYAENKDKFREYHLVNKDRIKEYAKQYYIKRKAEQLKQAEQNKKNN